MDKNLAENLTRFDAHLREPVPPNALCAATGGVDKSNNFYRLWLVRCARER